MSKSKSKAESSFRKSSSNTRQSPKKIKVTKVTNIGRKIVNNINYNPKAFVNNQVKFSRKQLEILIKTNLKKKGKSKGKKSQSKTKTKNPTTNYCSQKILNLNAKKS